MITTGNYNKKSLLITTENHKKIPLGEDPVPLELYNETISEFHRNYIEKLLVNTTGNYTKKLLVNSTENYKKKPSASAIENCIGKCHSKLQEGAFGEYHRKINEEVTGEYPGNYCTRRNHWRIQQETTRRIVSNT